MGRYTMRFVDDFNPRSPHGERRPDVWQYTSAYIISTHAPRTGSDVPAFGHICDSAVFQPTLPARGATFPPLDEVKGLLVFQPTLPARGATRARAALDAGHQISTHAPRTGSDAVPTSTLATIKLYFNPRSPHGERPDLFNSTKRLSNYFNPRSPHGERLDGMTSCVIHRLFQPTLPARGATRAGRGVLPGAHISTHAPRTGSDNGFTIF